MDKTYLTMEELKQLRDSSLQDFKELRDNLSKMLNDISEIEKESLYKKRQEKIDTNEKYLNKWFKVTTDKSIRYVFPYQAADLRLTLRRNYVNEFALPAFIIKIKGTDDEVLYEDKIHILDLSESEHRKVEEVPEEEVLLAFHDILQKKYEHRVIDWDKYKI